MNFSKKFQMGKDLKGILELNIGSIITMNIINGVGVTLTIPNKNYETQYD
jgi:hypothetical protein